jgi:hypothetical protein
MALVRSAGGDDDFSGLISKFHGGGACDMRKITRLGSLLFSVVLMLAVGLSLAATAPGSQGSTTKTHTQATAGSRAVTPEKHTKSMRKPGAEKMGHALASAEDLSGTITMVGPSDKEVTLIGSNGVPYDFQLTKKTEVELANQKIEANTLGGELYKQATVHFVPTSDGNLAETIEIGAS